jgi:hypothetical protein
MSYLFIKNLFQREKSLNYFHKKFKKLKKPKKTTQKPFLVGFFRWVILGFFWVGFFYCQPCLQDQLAHATAARQVGQALQAAYPVLGVTRL